jgi:hypothetical protein
MTLGLTEALTEMSTTKSVGRRARPVRKAENLTAVCVKIVYKT